MRLLCSIVTALVLSTAATKAQVQSPDALGRVAGHVVTALGELVPGATVTLTGRTNDDRPERWTTTSDISGAFSITGIPDGRYRLGVTMDGYTNRQPAAVDAPQGLIGGSPFGTGQEIQLVGSAQMTAMQLVLHRAASITGRVVRPDGSAAANLQVFAGISGPRAGPMPLLETSTTSAADGRYEIRGLPPGDYLVGVIPGRTSLMTWYPGGTQKEPGSVALLDGIDLAGNDIWLAPADRFNVSGRIFWPVGVNAENITIDYGDPAGTRSGVWVVSDPGGLFTVEGVRPGPLTLLARAESDQGTLLGIATTEVSGDSLDGVQLLVDRPGAIGGRVVYEGNVPASSRATSIVGVQKLMKVSPLFPVPESRVDDLGRFALRGAIGEYEFALDGLGRGLGIRRVMRSGVALQQNRVAVAGGEIVDEVEIVVGVVGR